MTEHEATEASRGGRSKVTVGLRCSGWRSRAAAVLAAALTAIAVSLSTCTPQNTMPEPLLSLRYPEAMVLNLALLDPTLAEQVAAVRQLLLSLPDSTGRISCTGVFETGLISVSCPVSGTSWQVDFQFIWPQPLMDGKPGELKLINWYAAGRDSPAGGKVARDDAVRFLRERIESLSQPGTALAGRLRVLNSP